MSFEDDVLDMPNDRLDALTATHTALCAEALAFFSDKNHDYTNGSGDPFHNLRGATSLGIEPVQGILLRMQDKIQRINTFASKGVLKTKNEGLKDAVLDIINYAVLAYALSQDP